MVEESTDVDKIEEDLDGHKPFVLDETRMSIIDSIERLNTVIQLCRTSKDTRVVIRDIDTQGIRYVSASLASMKELVVSEIQIHGVMRKCVIVRTTDVFECSDTFRGYWINIYGDFEDKDGIHIGVEMVFDNSTLTPVCDHQFSFTNILKKEGEDLMQKSICSECEFIEWNKVILISN